MRILTVTCMTLVLTLQLGCSMIPKSVVQKKTPPDDKAAEKYLAARRLEGQGKFELARESYAELIVKYPNHAEYQHRLGVVCTQQQRFAEAERYYEKARKLAPKNASILSDMGYSYVLRGDLLKAEDTLNEALHLKPGDKRATSNLALVKGIQGKMDESLALLKEVNDEAGALTDLAYIHRRRGEMELAEERYHDVLSLDPKNKAAMEGLAEVEKLNQSGKRMAKKSPDKAKDTIKTAVAEGSGPPKEILQVAAEADTASNNVRTAGFTQEEWTDEREPRLLKDRGDDSDVADDDEHDLDDDEPVVIKNGRQSRGKADDWDDDSADSMESGKSKATKKSSAVTQAGFQFEDKDDPFAKPKHKPQSAPDFSEWEGLKPDTSTAAAEITEADDETETEAEMEAAAEEEK